DQGRGLRRDHSRRDGIHDAVGPGRPRPVYGHLGEAQRPMARRRRARDTVMNQALILAFVLFAALQRESLPGRSAEREGWPVNGCVDNIRYSPLNQITRENVSKLQVAWTYDSHDAF